MRERMRKAGGILTIVGGIIIVAGSFIATGGPWALIPGALMPGPEAPPAGVVGGLIALGVVALIGGICALRGRMWGLALAGAICATFPAAPAGVLAIIFISLAKREFE